MDLYTAFQTIHVTKHNHNIICTIDDHILRLRLLYIRSSILLSDNMYFISGFWQYPKKTTCGTYYLLTQITVWTMFDCLYSGDTLNTFVRIYNF